MAALCKIFFLFLLTVSFITPLKADHFRLVTARFLPFTDPDDPKQGYLVHLTRRALALNGHSLEVTFQPWPRALMSAANGKFDGILSAFYTIQRGQDYYFSSPLNATEMVLIGLKNNFPTPYYANYDALENKRVAIGRKWAYSDAFNQSNSLVRHFVNDEKTAINLLYHQRVDLIAINKDQFHENLKRLKEHDPDAVQILHPSISQNLQYVAASKHNSNSLYFLAELNNGIAAMRSSGEFDRIHKEFFDF